MQEVQHTVPLAARTTFGIGGSAEHFVDVRSDDEIREAIQWARENNMPFTVLGGGSNVLVPDEGVRGLVIHLVGDLYGVADGTVDAWAGTNLLALIRSMNVQGFGGWEKLAGIPGSVGGAVRGNAGAFGSEIKDFVTSVRALNTQSGDEKDFSNEACDFSYRHSFFKDHPEWIVTRVQVRLGIVNPEEAKRVAEATIAERERRHLQNVRAAGSYFMNPTASRTVQEMFEREKGVASREGRVPAGWLIDKAGMKGVVVGGAIASLQHPNYLVNQGTATAKDVRELAEKVRAAVSAQFGVELREEAAVL